MKQGNSANEALSGRGGGNQIRCATGTGNPLRRRKNFEQKASVGKEPDK